VGSDVTYGGDGFNKYFNSGDFVRVYARIEGDEFYLYIDDFFLDFDGGGGASATDVVYSTGTVGIGVKDIIAKFDNFQVCGCPPVAIVPADETTVTADLAAGTPVTLTLTDVLTGSAVAGPISWDVSPSTCGTFDSNPSSGASVVFTANGVDFPDYFTATTSDGCIGSFYPIPPTPTSYVDDFDDQDDSRWTECDNAWSIVEYPTGSGNYVNYGDTGGGSRRTYLSDPAAEAFWQTSVTQGLAWDNYTAEVDVYLENDDRTNWGGSVAYLLVRKRPGDCNHFYLLGIRNSYNEDGSCPIGSGAEVRFSVYNGGWTCHYGTELSPSPYDRYFFENTMYHMKIECVNNTFNCEVTDAGGTVLDSFSYTDTNNRFPLGPPGLRIYGDGAYYDNFTVTPAP